MSRRLTVLLAALLMAAGTHAKAPRIFAITEVRIVTAPGRIIERGTVVMRDGIIESVGADIEVPPDAWTIAGEEGWTVYPSFIDAAANVGLEAEPASGPPGRPGGGSGGPRAGAPHELESVRADTAVVDELDFTHNSIERHRELGFAVAQVLPAKGVFRGESAVIALREAPAPELIIDSRSAQVVALETSSFMARKYPSSSIGAVATVRQTLLDAERQLIWTDRYTADPVGMPRPQFRATDAPLLAVARGELPIIFISRNPLDPGRFNEFVTEFGLRAVTVATGLGHRADLLRAAQMPLLLPLQLPDEPDVAEADEALDTTLEDMQAYLRAPGLPAELAADEIDFAFVTLGMKSVRDAHETLAAVVAAGLEPDRALAALTTVPARLLGLEQTLGTIEAGKQANVLVVDGDLFAAKPAAPAHLRRRLSRGNRG